MPEQIAGELYILDMTGKVVRQVGAVHTATHELDISDLPIGLYSVEFVPTDNKERLVYTAMLSKL